jgi:hypothetical protein
MQSLESRFWSKVNKEGPVPVHRPELGSCWVWTASHGAGIPGYPTYGTFYFGKVNGKYKWSSPHRVSFFLEHGHMPTNDIDHLCRNTMCVNPLHLEDVTTSENLRRAPKHIVHGDEARYARAQT